METTKVIVGLVSDLDDPGCREFTIGEGDWPFRGFIIRQGDEVYAYQNFCMHAGHPLNWKPDGFLTGDGSQIICSSHGAIYEIESGECVAGPCPGRKLRPVEVEIRNGEVVVRGPASLAVNRGL
ncbi:MAG: Rieske (2Fe-2S) protein [Gammaproteobacteria bacterium]|nr:Rieske (2Fe-2S) protein [Gammaproteobacteria bacterium]